MMILALRFRRTKQADHAVCIKGVSGSTQGTFRQTGFLRSFCRWRPK
jgi:anti-anti-sigma regulatory factor